VRPCCGQLYNLFHACDPNAARIEPLIQSEFSQINPCCISRYSQFPLGDGESSLLGRRKICQLLHFPFSHQLFYLVEYVHQHSKLFLSNNKNQSPNEISTLFSDSNYVFSIDNMLFIFK